MSDSSPSKTPSDKQPVASGPANAKPNPPPRPVKSITEKTKPIAPPRPVKSITERTKPIVPPGSIISTTPPATTALPPSTATLQATPQATTSHPATTATPQATTPPPVATTTPLIVQNPSLNDKVINLIALGDEVDKCFSTKEGEITNIKDALKRNNPSSLQDVITSMKIVVNDSKATTQPQEDCLQLLRELITLFENEKITVTQRTKTLFDEFFKKYSEKYLKNVTDLDGIKTILKNVEDKNKELLEKVKGLEKDTDSNLRNALTVTESNNIKLRALFDKLS